MVQNIHGQHFHDGITALRRGRQVQCLDLILNFLSQTLDHVTLSALVLLHEGTERLHDHVMNRFLLLIISDDRRRSAILGTQVADFFNQLFHLSLELTSINASLHLFGDSIQLALQVGDLLGKRFVLFTLLIEIGLSLFKQLLQLLVHNRPL